jgi:drug/metabolite transporter superfamily protein YnfA
VSNLHVWLVDTAAILLIVWVFNLIRRGRLYVGYGAIFVLVTAAGAAVLSIPALLDRFNWFGTLLTSASGLVVLALAFTLVMLIYVLGQLTLLSNRVTSLAQELAIRRATEAQVSGPPRSESPAAGR